jgi:hypothetical protein
MTQPGGGKRPPNRAQMMQQLDQHEAKLQQELKKIKAVRTLMGADQQPQQGRKPQPR